MGETIFSPMVTDAIGEIMNISLGSVSYTHLTLPTTPYV